MTTATQHAYDSYEALVEDYFERGWTDGLPIMPPTPEKVAAFLEHARPLRGRGAWDCADPRGDVHRGTGRSERGHGRLPARVLPNGGGRGSGPSPPQGQLPLDHRHIVGRCSGCHHQRSRPQ